MTMLLLILLVHGLFLAALLGGFGRRHDRANGLLALVILVVSLLLLEAYLGRSGLASRWPHLRGVFRPLWFLVGPLCYVYTVRFLGRRARRVELLLGLPALATLLATMPFYLRTAEEKLAGPQYAGGTAGMLVTYLAFSGFTAWCALLSRRAIHDGRCSASALSQPWRHGWLRWLMGALAVYAGLDFVGSAFLVARGSYPAAAAVGSVVILASVIYGAGLLAALPEGLLARAPWPGKKYERTEIPEKTAELELARLGRLMTEERPWLDEDLNLDDLASRLGVSRHHLSQLMNQHLRTTFHRYVNVHRIDEAKRLLLDVGSRRSILDVGFEAGFGSSATFYRAFKKHVGLTPKDFLAGTAGADTERFRQGARRGGGRRADEPTS